MLNRSETYHIHYSRLIYHDLGIPRRKPLCGGNDVVGLNPLSADHKSTPSYLAIHWRHDVHLPEDRHFALHWNVLYTMLCTAHQLAGVYSERSTGLSILLQSYCASAWNHISLWFWLIWGLRISLRWLDLADLEPTCVMYSIYIVNQCKFCSRFIFLIA